jgi:hypothetical protein
MKILLTIFLLCILNAASFSQSNDRKKLDSLCYSNKVDSLEQLFGHRKTYPEEHKTVFFTTLSFFPELEATKIRFKETRIRTTMNVRPTLGSMFFRNKENRKYVIRINNTKREGKPMFSEASFNAQVGILGHEFSHIADYKRQNFFGMGKRAISYLFKKSKTRYESQIDAYAIRKGIGYQLYDWKYFVHNESNASEKYLRFKRRIYLMPDDVMQLIYE